MAWDWLAGEDERFVAAVDAAVAEGETRCGARLDYGRACPACCLGPFPINRLDVLRLRRGLLALFAREPERAAAIGRAAVDAVRDYAPHFPGDAATGRLVDEPGGRDAFFARFSRRPCPALDLASGRCQLYAARPLTCRTFGPPVHLSGLDMEACAPCFNGGPEEQTACRVPLDAGGQEDALLDRLEEEEGDQGETLIAHALAQPLLPP